MDQYLLKKIKLLRHNRVKSIMPLRGILPEVKFEYSLIDFIKMPIYLFVVVIIFTLVVSCLNTCDLGILYKFPLVLSIAVWLWLGFWIVQYPRCLTSTIMIKPILLCSLFPLIVIDNNHGKSSLPIIFCAILLYFLWSTIVNFKYIVMNAAATKQSSIVDHFGLWLGTSTGTLTNLWHCTGISGKQQVTLRTNDTCQNILILGGIGSGKTTAVMQPLLLQCLDQNCGGLIFDIKGDVKNAVTVISSVLNKQPILIGPNHIKLNLLNDLTPEVAASFLKSAFLLSNKGNLDSFWIDTAAELCRNILGILSFIPKHYNLQSLYQYLFDPQHQNILDQKIEQLSGLTEPQSRLLKSYQSYNQLIFINFDPKVKSGVMATVAQALSPFSHPALFDAFCSTETSFNMEDLTNGKIYVVDLPLAMWGLGAKVVYTFIKLRFFNLMQTRGNPTSPVFFMCDEYQEIISANPDGLSDLNFWDKSRSSKTIGIISSQSMASFYAAIGSRDLTHAILQNFRQKLCLRTEDPDTLHFISSLLGYAKIQRLSKSRNSEHKVSQAIIDSKEAVIDAQLFRDLQPQSAIAVLSINNHSMDDILDLEPVYLT